MPNYIGAMVTLLEGTVNKIASYGEFKVLEGLGATQTISVSFPMNVDPLGKPVEEQKIILPWTEEGKVLQKALKRGFIRANVLPPVEGSKINRYFIDQGMITLKWPEPITKMLSWYLGNWKTVFDLSAAQSLRYLFRYAPWDEAAIELPKLSENPPDRSLDKYYNTMVMKNHLAELFDGTDQAKVRDEATRILDRFIMVLLQYQGGKKRTPGNKEKADRYAYIRVKAILASKSDSERREYTNERVIGMILDKANEEDLMIKISRANCLAACQRFEAQYGWSKKRGKTRS